MALLSPTQISIPSRECTRTHSLDVLE